MCPLQSKCGFLAHTYAAVTTVSRMQKIKKVHSMCRINTSSQSQKSKLHKLRCPNVIFSQVLMRPYFSSLALHSRNTTTSNKLMRNVHFITSPTSFPKVRLFRNGSDKLRHSNLKKAKLFHVILRVKQKQLLAFFHQI